MKNTHNQPFIIKSKVLDPLVPIQSSFYDQGQQSRIQIIQAINGYLIINMLYQSFKLLWSFWHYQTQCPDYAYLSLGFMGINIIWAITSYYGFRSIRSKNSRNITIFSYTVTANLILRIIMYIICGVVMKGYVPSYMEVNKQQINKLICKALYPQALFVIQGIFQAIVSIFVLFITKGIVEYVRKWELNQIEKSIPLKGFS